MYVVWGEWRSKRVKFYSLPLSSLVDYLHVDTIFSLLDFLVFGSVCRQSFH